MRQKKYRSKLKKHGVNLCWPATPVQAVCFGVWLIYLGTLHWKKLIFPFPAGINYIASCLGVELYVCLPFLVLGMSGLELCMFCHSLVWVLVHNLCVFICVLVLLCLEDTVPSESPITPALPSSFCLLFYTDLWAFRERLWHTPSGPSVPKPLTPCTSSWCGCLC